MPFSKAANRRVAGHSANGTSVERHQCGTRALSGGGSGGFCPSMASSNDDDIEIATHVQILGPLNLGHLSMQVQRDQKNADRGSPLRPVSRLEQQCQPVKGPVLFHVKQCSACRYFPMQKREKRLSSISSTPARPISRSIASRASRRYSAIISRSLSVIAAPNVSTIIATALRWRSCRA